MLALLLVAAAADNFQEPATVMYPLMQSYDGVNWETRGELKVKFAGERSSSVTYQNRKFEKERLDKTGMYWVGLDSGDIFLKTALPVCALASADLKDSISLHVDFDHRRVLSLTYRAGTSCNKFTTVALKPSTSVEIEQVQLSPKPAFFTKPLTEAEEEPGFLRKYWWVLILVYFLLLRGSPAQPQQAAT